MRFAPNNWLEQDLLAASRPSASQPQRYAAGLSVSQMIRTIKKIEMLRSVDRVSGVFFTSTFLLLSAGCAGSGSEDASLESVSALQTTSRPKPAVEFVSPDATLRSFWRLREWRDEHYFKEFSREFAHHQVFGSSAREEFESHAKKQVEGLGYQKGNRVDELEIVTPTRAEIIALEYIGTLSEEPTKRKYVLSEIGGKWLIEDMLDVCWNCSGSGEEEDIDQRMKDYEELKYDTNPMKKCDQCNGTGWESRVFRGR